MCACSGTVHMWRSENDLGGRNWFFPSVSFEAKFSLFLWLALCTAGRLSTLECWDHRWEPPHPATFVGSRIKLRLLDSRGRYFMCFRWPSDDPPSLSLQHSDYRSVLLQPTFYMDPGNQILVFSARLASTLTTEPQMTSCRTVPGVLWTCLQRWL